MPRVASSSAVRTGRGWHPYAAVLGALAVAMSALDTHDTVWAQALEGIDFDLPEATPTVQDRAQLHAAAPLYFSSELERAGLLTTAELIAGLFASGAITQPLGPTANLLHDFWRGRRERLAADERNAIFGRVIEVPHFERLMRALCESIVMQADGVDLREQVLLATQVQGMATFLSQRVDPMATIAAKDIVEAINRALLFLRDRQLQSAFGVADLWRLLAIVASQNGLPAGLAQQHVERGRNGQTVLLWLSDHLTDRAIRLEAGQPDDMAVIVAAQRWLASTPGGGAGLDGAKPGVA